MPTVRLQGPSNIVFVLEEGTLDDRALLVFTGGQCHALALALQRRTGWPLVAVDETTGVCVHICVRRPDGLLLDVTGAHTVEELITARGGTVRDVDYAAIEELEAQHGWAKAEIERAETWVDAVLGRAVEGAPLKPMSSNEFERVLVSEDGLEVRIRWGGLEYMEAYVRRASESSEQEWTSYGSAALPADPETGAVLIDFTADQFEQLTSEWAAKRFDRGLAERKLADVSQSLIRREQGGLTAPCLSYYSTVTRTDLL